MHIAKEQMRVLKNKMAARARVLERATEDKAETSNKRLKKMYAAQGEAEELRQEVETLKEEMQELSKANAELKLSAERISAMPSWCKVRGTGAGRGTAKFEYDHRVTIYSMIANGTPLSAIGHNICAVVRRTAPWLKPQVPSARVLADCRFELRFIEECLAGRRVASAYAIRMMGFDETTKKGNPALTSNVIIEPKKGAPLEPVILKGAYCSAGGTSEALAAAIESKCFKRLRSFLESWKTKFFELYPGETWTGPEAEQLSMGRLAGGGALMSDTCNTAEKAKRLLAEMIAEQAQEAIGVAAWVTMSEAEQKDATRVHKLDCYQHLRNIFLKEMSSAQAKHVAEELKPHLDKFSSWERITTDYSQLLRAAYKEFHQGNVYYKGKGREFWVWMEENHPTDFIVHFERAEGGRQDLDYDAAVPLYIMRPYMVEFLHTLVFGADHSNILEDFLYYTFRSEQFIAMTRANAVIDLLVSKPLRWLAGSSYMLHKWSPVSMTRTLDRVEQLFEKASTDGSMLLDASLNVFEEIAEEQPKFAAYLKHVYEEWTQLSADGKTSHLVYKLTQAELFNPKDQSNSSSTVRAKTIEYLEVQCVAGLRKLRDPKLALANKLTSLDGSMSFTNSVQAHADTIGLDASNDRLAESFFGMYDYVLRRCPGISMEAASAVAMAMLAKSWEDGGTFHALPSHEAHALVELARTSVCEQRAVDRADHAEHDAYVTKKRKSNSQLELNALVKQYALALSFFKKWQSRRVASVAAMHTALAALELPDDVRKQTQEQLNYLREQIEMRVVGCGFQYKLTWYSSKSEEIGTVADLTELLIEILNEEGERQTHDDLPKVAAVPVMKRKSFKELGTPTAQAKALAPVIKELSPEELLALAVVKRKELEAAGEIDEVGDSQPEHPPALDDSLIGTQLEVCWRYWRPPTEEEKGQGEKRKKIAVPIWCEGDVMLVANGTTHLENPESASCKKLAAAGAVRIKWPADPTREVPEPESFTWSILQEAMWNSDKHLGWRFTAAELRKRAEACG